MRPNLRPDLESDDARAVAPSCACGPARAWNAPRKNVARQLAASDARRLISDPPRA